MTTRIEHSLTGCGSKSTMQIMYFIAMILADQARLAEYGEKHPFNLQTTVVDTQPEEEVGSGYAFQSDVDAAANVPPAGLPAIAGLDRIPEKIRRLLDLAQCSADYLEKNFDEYLAEVKETNPAVAASILNARQGGKINPGTACTTRAIMGKTQRDCLTQLLALANETIPWLTIPIRQGTVTKVYLDNPAIPVQVVSRGGSKQITRCDYIQANTGTPLLYPLSGDVKANAFCDRPTGPGIKKYLESRGLLDDNGMLIPGKRVGVVGASLSGYDMMNLSSLFAELAGLTQNQRGTWCVTIDPDRAKSYAGAFFFISRHDGQVAPPKHGYGLAWPGPKVVGTTEQIHALFLDTNPGSLALATKLVFANAARALRKVPAEVYPPMSTAERMADYHRQNLAYFNGDPHTEANFLRAGYQALVMQRGFEADPEDAESSLAAKAPLTRGQRGMWTFNRVCWLKENEQENNSGYARFWDQMLAYLTAQTPELQDYMAQLVTTRAAEHLIASWTDISFENGQYRVNGTTFDALLFPGILTEEADKVFTSFNDVDQLVAGQPAFAKGRLLRKNGKPTNCSYTGIGCRGKIVDGSVIGRRAADYSHLSSSQLSIVNARMQLCHALLRARGVEDTAGAIADIYRSQLPTEEPFDQEAAQSRNKYYELHEQIAFLDLCADLAGTDGDAYTRFYDQVFTKESRLAVVNEYRAQATTAVEAYENRIKNIPPYTPATRDQYYARFVDYTEAEADRIYEEVLRQG